MVEILIHAFLISALDESEWSDSRSGSFNPSTHLYRRMGGLQHGFGHGDEAKSPYSTGD